MKLKQVLGLVVGLIVGVVGGVLFSKSLAPEEGSLEEKYEIVSVELANSQRRLEAYARYEQDSQGRTGDRLRDLARDIKDGKEISPDDLFGTMKPWMRQMAPIFEKMREVNAEDWAGRQTSEWARDYDLSKAEREELKEWFKARSEERSQELTSVIASDSSGFVDFVKATEYDWRDSRGIEPLMEGMLEGEELEKFQNDRLAKRAESVQEEADRNLSRLDDLVALDDAQHRELFGVLSRGARDYEPAIGESGEAALDLAGRDAAIESVLRADQVELLNEHRAQRRAEAEAQMERLQMTLPKNWDALERNSF